MLQKIADDVYNEPNADNDSQVVVRVFGTYCYLKIGLLFTSEDSLQQAKTAGLIDRIITRVELAIKTDPAFRSDRNLLDSQQMVYATANQKMWNMSVR